MSRGNGNSPFTFIMPLTAATQQEPWCNENNDFFYDIDVDVNIGLHRFHHVHAYAD